MDKSSKLDQLRSAWQHALALLPVRSSNLKEAEGEETSGFVLAVICHPRM
jgi:hypothetical protein